MDPREIETLVTRLIANPHDEDALSRAHQGGQLDPQGYALLLERVAQGTADATFAGHWFNEAASVWETLGDDQQKMRLLRASAARDPANAIVADRLGQAFRDRGDFYELARLLERAVEAWSAALRDDPEVRPALLRAHEELARLYGEGQLANPDLAARHWAGLCDLDPTNVFAIYSARELLKSQGRYREAAPFFAKEQALIDDQERKLALLRDEAEVRRMANDGSGRTEALRQARRLRADDPALTYEFGNSVVERVDAGEDVPHPERQEAGQALLGLAEMYDGEYAMMYAAASLKAVPGDDRAMQLADYHAERMGRAGEIVPQYQAYLQANPGGYMAEKARQLLGAMGQPTAAPAGAVPARAMPSQPAPAAAPAGAAQQAPGPDRYASAPSGVAPAPAAAPVDEYGAPAGGEAGLTQAHVPGLLAQANEESQRGRKPQAYGKYRDVLKIDPANSEALAWVEDFLRQRRKFADLRDVLLAAARVSNVDAETRKGQLREVAGLCESKLRDFDTAILALKQICQIDRSDDAAREQLCSLLEKQKRWDELAPLLEQQAMNESDAETKIALEKKVAALHEQKRGDPAAAAEAWVRIAELARGDEAAITAAVGLYEQAQQFESAAGVLVDNMAEIADPAQKAGLLERLGQLRTKMGDQGGAGDAFAEAAQLGQKDATWELAGTAYAAAERWGDVANSLEQRAQLHQGVRRAELFSQAGHALVQAGNAEAALVLYEQAAELDPENDDHAARVEAQYQAEGRGADQVALLLRRANAIGDRNKRVALRHRAAQLQWGMGDEEGACDSWRQILAEGEDRPAVEALLQAAERRGDHEESVSLLERLLGMSKGPERLEVALRAAQIVAQGLNDVEGAILRYERILKEIDPKNRSALRAMAVLEQNRGNHPAAAEALEKELNLAPNEERVEIAQQLAELYEGPIGDLRMAVRALDIVHGADPEDFDAIARLQVLCERLEDWPRVAQLLGMLIEVEGDEEEASEMTRQLATLLLEKLGKGDEGLAALEKLADQGDVACQQAYTEMGIGLGWKGVVAQKLVQWYQGAAGTSRVEALRRAFDLFLEVGRDEDARAVALELARSRDADAEMASRLEGILVKLRDLDSLSVAHDLLARELSGRDRALEFVRQAEVMVQTGANPADAITQGEQALGAVDPAEAEQLLSRLAALTNQSAEVLDLYERQVLRCRQPAERINALARAAQVAAEQGALDRAREFFNAALSGGVQDDTIAALENAARGGGEAGAADGRALLQTLAEALAGGGQGSRDGGRTRGSLLRRAAVLAHRELRDVDRAFGWLTDAIIAHVDEVSLDALEQLAAEIGDMRRAEDALSRALDEVFDGPLVRLLLRRRSIIRRDQLGDLRGAAGDLKRLHDLSPSDQELTEELLALLTALQDHRGMIELYEDQILRGREPSARAEIARKVARIWEEHIGDAREAADAWRRVLRMRAGDDEATAGLERAKVGKLKRAPAGAAPPPPAAARPAPSAPLAPLAAPAPVAAPAVTPSPPTGHSGPASTPPAGRPPGPDSVRPVIPAPSRPPQRPSTPPQPPQEAEQLAAWAIGSAPQSAPAGPEWGQPPAPMPPAAQGFDPAAVGYGPPAGPEYPQQPPMVAPGEYMPPMPPSQPRPPLKPRSAPPPPARVPSQPPQGQGWPSGPASSPPGMAPQAMPPWPAPVPGGMPAGPGAPAPDGDVEQLNELDAVELIDDDLPPGPGEPHGP